MWPQLALSLWCPWRSERWDEKGVPPHLAYKRNVIPQTSQVAAESKPWHAKWSRPSPLPLRLSEGAFEGSEFPRVQPRRPEAEGRGWGETHDRPGWNYIWEWIVITAVAKVTDRLGSLGAPFPGQFATH